MQRGHLPSTWQWTVITRVITRIHSQACLSQCSALCSTWLPPSPCPSKSCVHLNSRQVQQEDLPQWPVEDSGESSVLWPINLCLNICFVIYHLGRLWTSGINKWQVYKVIMRLNSDTLQSWVQRDSCHIVDIQLSVVFMLAILTQKPMRLAPQSLVKLHCLVTR